MWAGAAVPAVDLHTASSVQTAPPLTCSETRTNTLSDLNHRSDQIQSWWTYRSQHPPWWCSVTMETIPLWDSIPKDHHHHHHHHTDNMRKVMGNTGGAGCAVRRDSWGVDGGVALRDTDIYINNSAIALNFFLFSFLAPMKETIWIERYRYKESTYKLFTPKSTPDIWTAYCF